MEFGQPSGTSMSASGRTFGNLTLLATAAKTYTSTGGSAFVVNNTLTLGTSVIYNPNMTGTFTLRGDIVNNGNGGTFQTTVAGSNIVLDGTSNISGNTGLTISGNGLTLNAGKSLTLTTPPC
jgi:hypothetical protein